ncbi:hypothetical protein II582_03685 [bacterium]|nr:hypothetical protein [bacterium]
MTEVITRRFQDTQNYPDLFILDG